MFRVFQILVSAPGRRLALAAGGVALLAACGQKGPLFLPTGEAAAGRASLTQTLAPSTTVAPATAAPPAAAASAPLVLPPSGRAAPVRNP